MTDHIENDHQQKRIIRLHDRIRTAESKQERTDAIRRLAKLDDDGEQQADVYRRLARER